MIETIRNLPGELLKKEIEKRREYIDSNHKEIQRLQNENTCLEAEINSFIEYINERN